MATMRLKLDLKEIFGYLGAVKTSFRHYVKQICCFLFQVCFALAGEKNIKPFSLGNFAHLANSSHCTGPFDSIHDFNTLTPLINFLLNTITGFAVY